MVGKVCGVWPHVPPVKTLAESGLLCQARYKDRRWGLLIVFAVEGFKFVDARRNAAGDQSGGGPEFLGLGVDPTLSAWGGRLRAGTLTCASIRI